MIQYILDVTLTWAILYLIFFTFLRKETFFNVNRYFLVSAIALGILLPFLRNISFNLQATDVPEVAPLVMFIQESPAIISQSIEEVRQVWYMNLYYVLGLIYAVGAFFFLARLVKGLWNIYSIYRESEKEHREEYTLVHSTADHLPFSFLNAIFISKNIPLKDEYNEVLTHELEHVKSHHSLDVLYMEIVNVLFWFNPLVYLYKSAIKQTHEYLADAAVLHQTDKKMYGHILLRQSLSGIQIALAHSFFHSHIKKRIKMMYQEKSGRWAGLKYLLALPLLALIVAAFSLKEENMEGFTSTEFAEEIYFHCDGREGSTSPVQFFPTAEHSEYNAHLNSHYIITDNIRTLYRKYNPESNFAFILDGQVLLGDEINQLDLNKGFSANLLTIYRPDYAIEKYGEIAKYGAVRIDGLKNELDQFTIDSIFPNASTFVEKDKNDPLIEFKQDRYETLRMGEDEWEAEIFSDYIGPLEVRILNSDFEIVHRLEVDKKEKKMILPLEYISDDKSHQIRIVEKKTKRKKESNLGIRSNELKTWTADLSKFIKNHPEGLVILDDQKYTVKSLDPDMVVNDVVFEEKLKANYAFQKYGERAKKGVYEVRTKNSFNALTRRMSEEHLTIENWEVVRNINPIKLIENYNGLASRRGNAEVKEYLKKWKIKLPEQYDIKKLKYMRHYYSSPHVQEIDDPAQVMRIKNPTKGKVILEVESDSEGELVLFTDQGNIKNEVGKYSKTGKLLSIELDQQELPKKGFKLWNSNIFRFKNGYLISDSKARKQWEDYIIKPYEDQSLKADNSQKRLTSIHYVKHLYFDNPFSTGDMDLSKERVHKKENQTLKLGPVFENFYNKHGLKKTFLWVINGKKIKSMEDFPLDFHKTYTIEHQEIYSPTLGKKEFGSEGRHGALVLTGVQIENPDNHFIHEENKKGILERMKDGVVDALGLRSYFKMTCHLPGLNYTVRHGSKDQLAFSFVSEEDRDVDIYFDHGNGVITKSQKIQKGNNQLAFPSIELPADPFVIRIGTEGIDCNCTFGVLEFQKERGKFMTNDQSVHEWDEKWVDEENEEKDPIELIQEMVKSKIPNVSGYTVLTAIDGKRPRSDMSYYAIADNYPFYEIIIGKKNVKDFLLENDPEGLLNWHDSEEALINFSKTPFEKKSNLPHNLESHKAPISQKPLLIINGKKFKHYDQINDVDPGDIDYINVFKGEEALNKFGEDGLHGVVEIFTKGSHISIKGNNNSNEKPEPLFVIDGEIQPRSPDVTKELDPNDIKEINVLKGEKAINKYGEDGINGVIEITLKKSNKWKDDQIEPDTKIQDTDTLIIFDAESYEERVYIENPNHIKSQVEGSNLISDIKVYNQNGDYIAVGFQTEHTGPSDVILSSIDGRVIGRKTLTVSKSKGARNIVEFGDVQVSNGIYIISIQQGDEVTSKKVSLFR